AECARLDSVDQGPHPLAASGCEVDVVGSAGTAFGGVRRRTTLARVDDITGEQGVARGDEAHILGSSEGLFDDRAIEMRLRPVEIEPGDFEAQSAKPVRLDGEQLIEPLDGR